MDQRHTIELNDRLLSEVLSRKREWKSRSGITRIIFFLFEQREGKLGHKPPLEIPRVPEFESRNLSFIWAGGMALAAELEFSVAASISMTTKVTKMYLFFSLGGNNTHAAAALTQLSI